VSRLIVVDYGDNVPGEAGAAALGTTYATGYLLHKKVTVFQTVTPGGIASLPSSYASGTSLTIMNRGLNAMLISPGPNQIENNPATTPVALLIGTNVNLTSFDPPAQTPPRIWWLGNPSNNSGVGNYLMDDLGNIITDDLGNPIQIV